MKVADLIDLLKDYDQDLEVVFSYDYGDYGHTLVADKVEAIDTCTVIHSSYHNRFKVLEEPEGKEGEEKVVILA